ncbi:NAD(P)-binding protein [Phlegmacium glaucopus]|nr:NAD(P)-binding protein [Phlegmacium glaucopus]
MSKVIFVTGASGFLGSHIVSQLLEKGYHVKAAARGRKAEALRVLHAKNSSIEIIEIADIIYDQFRDALVGVDAVIHTASPLPGRTDPQDTLNTAIEGTLNVLRQAEKAGVKKFVVTSSTIAVVGDPTVKGVAFRAEHWNPVTKEIALHGGSSISTYAAAKTFAERAVWEWAEAHPDVDVTTIAPPFLYGPRPPQFIPLPKPDFESLSTSLMIYNLLFPTGIYLPRPSYVDFRDVARAHVGALDSKPEKNRKRVVFSSPHGLTLDHVLDIIKKGHPELEHRLITGPVPKFEHDRYDLDFERIKEVTGLSKEDFHTLEETISDNVNDLLELEEEWKKNGYTFTEVPSI